ncbi:MAG TPA: dethiobiotin synthase [Nitrospiria bacterium]|jgi:dethiobiotin synthetase|nr:dethiobiotin synthase [Nitrospiria bacterium]
MNSGLFITGTDTGVGKTTITAGLAVLLRSRHQPVGVMKPIQTGCRRVNGKLFPNDTKILQWAAKTDDPLELVTPYRFHSPLAPFVAGRIERKRILPSKILRAYRRLKQRHSFILVEGIGGILVPITKKDCVLELIQLLKLPLLIVARSGLGTLNHTLLTVHQAREAGIPIVAIFLNTSRPQKQGLAEKTNPGILAELTGLPVFGPIPFIEGLQLNEGGFKKILKVFQPWQDDLLKLTLP